MPRYRVVFPPLATEDPSHRELSIHVHGLPPEMRVISVSEGKPEVFGATRGAWVSLRLLDVDSFGFTYHPGPPCEFTAGREPRALEGVLGVAIDSLDEPGAGQAEASGEPEEIEAVLEEPAPVSVLKGHRTIPIDPPE